MSDWYMLTLIGDDKPGIVAAVSKALYENGCNLGEASMMRLGGSFSIMVMAKYDGDADELEKILKPVTDSFELRTHIDSIDGKLHDHMEPDVRISVFSADRAGIVAKATGALASAGLNILHLDTDVGGSKEKPIFIMQIEGVAQNGIEALRAAVSRGDCEELDIRIESIETLIG